MLPKLHVPWRSLGRTSLTSARQGADDLASDSTVTLLSKHTSTIQGLEEFSKPHHIAIDTHRGPISSVQFLPDGQHIVCSGRDGMVRWWKVEESADHASEVGIPIHSAEGTSRAVISKDGKWMVLAGTDGRRVAVWDTSTRKKLVESMEAHEEKITAFDVSPDALKVATGSRDGVVIVWCLGTGRRIAGPLKQPRSVLSLRFSPTGDHVASAGPDYSVHVWSIGDNTSLSPARVPTDLTSSLAWSHDGRFLFAGCRLGSIWCFNISCSPPTRTKWLDHPHFDSVSTLRLSNNGKFIISASRSERFVRIWDIHTRSEILSLQHTSEVLDAELSPDDGYLVSGTNDGKICIWDLRRSLPTSCFFHSVTACLSPFSPPNSHPILTEISNAAYIPWRNAELTKAEAILSGEIERDTSFSHRYLANRALIRARLGRWSEAMDDAQGLSLAALFAQSAVHSGQNRYNDAIGVLDNALKVCNPEEKDFVDAIKAITLFDAGDADAAIRHVNDLVARCPEVQQPCAVVQAKMYALLGEDAMNRQQYVNAMSLFTRARSICPFGQYPEIDTLSLISGWVFKSLRVVIHRRSCEACYAAGLAQELLDSIHHTESSLRDEIKLKNEFNRWFTDFKSRSAEMLECQGDSAMRSKNYDGAITLYTGALGVAQTTPQVVTLFVKRSKARTASCLWDDALQDADEAIKSNPSSPWGYERKHAALHKLDRYKDAIDALKRMISVMESSSDPEIRQLRGGYVDPSDTQKAILEALKRSAHKIPFRLLDTTSGRLCDADKRREMFTEDPIFQELVSSMANQLYQERIDRVTEQFFQYAMLSHRWETVELRLADVSGKSIYELDTSPSATKLQQFCRLARDAKLRWAWSDTCCIDKDRDVEFEKSINSMFHWYRRSAATIVYLTGVPPRLIPGALKRSIWMTRGWTLQELLAPPIIRFYCEDWSPYLNNTSLNHKESAVIMQELEDVTGVKKDDLLAFRPGPENVRVKLRLASTRETTEPVDMAYGLFGIFGVTMPVVHGERPENALGRLLQEIVARSGDVACIAWVGQSSKFNSAFPNHIRVYKHLSRTVPPIGEEEMERQIVDLRCTWTHEDEVRAAAFYHKLHTLPPARCINQLLHLPCIVFPLTALMVKRIDGARVYRAMASALEDTDIHTKERFLREGQGPENFALACPWIYELLDETRLRQGRCYHPSGEGDPPDSDSGSEPDSDHDVCADTDFDLPHNAPPDHTDTTLKALKLVIRLRQPLGALLLLSQGRGQYRRVAVDHNIIIRVRDRIPLDDMTLQTLGVR